MRLLAPAVAAASLALVLSVPARPARTAAATPTLTVRPDPPTATADFKWVFGIQVNNTLDVGLYPDSIVGFAEDLDSGRTDAPRRQLIPLSHFRRLFTPISAGATQGFHYTGNGYFEHARITLTLYAHLAAGKQMKLEKVFEVLPGPSTKKYATEYVSTAAGRIEVVTVPRLLPGDGQRVPAILVIHGAPSHARRQLVFAREAALAGYHVVLMSLPGYGLSEGQADLMGAASLEAAERAFERLRTLADADTSRLSVWGVGEGAGVVARLAARRSDIHAVVLQGGVYDLWAVARARGRDTASEFARAAGRDSAAWRERSAVVSATRIHAPVLLLHSARDTGAPLAQAQAYAAALLAAGTRAKLSEVEGSELSRPIGITSEAGLDFIAGAGRQP